LNKYKIILSVILAVLFLIPSIAGCSAKTETVISTTTATTTATFDPGTGKVYVGGNFALTGAYAEDCAAVLGAYQDYVKYVNATKKLAPWRTETFPAGITLEVLWRDDELNVSKTLSLYEELKAAGLMVQKISGSPQAQALIDVLYQDHVGAVTMATGPYLVTPPKTIFTYYPIYTDQLAAVADWFMANWKGTEKPKVAYLTADSSLGKAIETPEMKAYLEKVGFEFVGAQYVPQPATSPPTTQLLWLKQQGVNLTLGAAVNPTTQPTIKEANRLGMGPNLDYKITFAFCSPSHLAVFTPAMGKEGDGTVVAGSFTPLDDLTSQGNQFMKYLQDTYRPTSRITHIMYAGGILEIMIQVEAIRLALTRWTVSQLTPQRILEDGFYRISNLNTGDISSTPITYGLGKIEGVDLVAIHQQQNGKVVLIGTYPLHHVYAVVQ
jgi:ABC-type branched-subunit amino acid transport system substrate-binding protein